MSDALAVYLRSRRVGRVWLDARGRFSFRYDSNWLTADERVPLSLGLPLREEPYPDDEARPFFANLLPESDLRRVIARRLGLSEGNDFALLQAVGGECAGAVSVLAEDVAPRDDGAYRFLEDADLDALMAELPRRPLLAGEEGIRLSLAGAQNKLPVLYREGRIALPLGGAPSSHILKPAMALYPHTVENEAFSMGLAARAGLPVPRATLLHRAGNLYLVARYDRQRDADGRLQRLHQEDFCQALGVPPDRKYEKEGGPGLAACFGVLQEHSIRPVQDRQHLLKWVVFNYLTGNADAHAKNISLMLNPQGPVLAPFYDLLCTALYPELTARLAMAIGGEDRPDWVIGRRWRRFAEEVEIGYKLVRRTLLDQCEGLPGHAAAEAEAFRAAHGDSEVPGRILGVIEQRCRKTVRALDADGRA